MKKLISPEVVNKNHLIKRIKYYMCLPKRKPKCSFTGSNGGEFEDISSIEIYSEEDNDVAKTATLKKGQMAMTKKPKKPKRNSKFNRIFRHVDIA